MANQTPTEEVIRMNKLGMNDSQIITKLTEQGFNPVQIHDALTQSKVRNEVSARTPEQQGMKPSIMPQTPPQSPFQTAKPMNLPQIPPPQQQPPKEMELPVPKPSAVPPLPQSMQKQPESPRQLTPQQPSPQQDVAYPYVYPTYEEPTVQPPISTEAFEELAEEIVNEKWNEVKSKITEVIEWKSYAEKRIVSMDDRVKRIELNMDRLQVALLSKVNEYGRGIKDLGAEMSSLEGALGKILSPLVENVKELGQITEDLKKKTGIKTKTKPKRRK